MSLEDDLLNDLNSGDESESMDISENDIYSAVRAIVENHRLIPADVLFDAEEPASLSTVLPITQRIEDKMNEFSSQEASDYHDLLSFVNSDEESEEYKFVVAVNELSAVVHSEIASFHQLVKSIYEEIFPELAALVTNPVDYARMVLLIKDNLTDIKALQPELATIAANEKVLVIVMSASLLPPNKLSEEHAFKMVSACRVILELDGSLQRTSAFISGKLARFAPNVSAIVGPITTSQLLIATGLLRQLAQTPSCNLPSLGVKEYSTERRATNNVRQQGYIYNSDVLKYLPADIVRSVMRIVSGKVVLAARIDLAKSDMDAKLGHKMLEEISNKIDKLLTPPKQTGDKALPKPEEHKSKKRGGRRLRKYKERFQMSEMRKAQNKMEFGKQEETYMDAFGEEVGIGMSRSLAMAPIKAKSNLKLSKAMAARVQGKNEVNNTFRESDSVGWGEESEAKRRRLQ